MGAALALMLAANRGHDVAGVISVNVSVDNKDPRRFLLPVLKRITPSFPGIVDDIKKPGVTESGYDRLPLHAAHSMLDFYRNLEPALPKVTQPLLVFCSTVDHVADKGSHQKVLASVSLGRRHRADAAGHLPRGHARQRRPDDLPGVRAVRPQHRPPPAPGVATTGLPSGAGLGRHPGLRRTLGP